MVGATNRNQFPWFINMAVPNIFMVFHKAIFVLRVLVNQDKDLWILLHFYLPDLQTDWFFVLKYPFCQQYFVLIYKNAGETNLLLC